MDGNDRNVSEPERVTDFFDSHVEDYEAKHYAGEVRSFMTVRQERVLQFVDELKLPRGAHVLDAGCGPGYLLEALARRGLQAYGMDAAAGMLRSAQVRLDAARPAFPVSLEQGNIERLPYADASFDLVCSTGVIEYLKQDATMLREVLRVLRPGGSLVLPVTNLWSPVNYLDFFIEFMKRRDWFVRPFNAVWQRLGHGPLIPRHFSVRRHSPAALRQSLTAAGLVLRDEVYFYFLPWPRPFDRIFPRATARMERWLARFGRSWIGPMAEGYLTVSSKPVTASPGS
jgi:ubiquinone/menaquinone biosynthesis C-methylase UbiE